MMAITFIPKPGMVLMCDFGPVETDVQAPGLMKGPLQVPPEMTKRRFVVVLTPSKKAFGTCIVVPLSTKVPSPILKHHHRIKSGKYSFLNGKDSWIKADMLTVVSLARLDRVKDNGKWASPEVSPEDFTTIKECVRQALLL